jgi:cytidine deaminase
MLLMSAGDEVELDNWRTKYGRCQLLPAKMRRQPTLQEALTELPPLLALILRVHFRASGWLGPLSLSREEVADVCGATNMAPREISALLLGVASAMAQMPGDGNHIGAVAEGESGNLYVGAPYAWAGKGIKFSAHGVQTAVLNAWHQGEKRLSSLMVETPPCACCRQFLHELHNWNAIKLYVATEGPKSLKKGSVVEIEFSNVGLRGGGIKEELMNRPPRELALGKSDNNELINLAADAASKSYAPYSNNNAGIALRTKQGIVYQGRYVESKTSILGALAIETALLNLIMSGDKIENVKEILLVETRGMVTQFSATQKLTMAMGDIPFRFMMTT